jgi:hypothetical protein
MALLAISLGGLLITRGRAAYHLVDRCCFDLDGGGVPDDGLQVTADRHGRVERLLVYEDQDGSRVFRRGDPLRYERGARPGIALPLAAKLVAMRDCCFDLDGQGPADDGLVALVVPPNRVMFAAIYEAAHPPRVPVADTFLAPLR